ncbi:LutC/YkgG family protein [Candidatus Marinarcus aquaticus]|uniref:LUD domain-containing protein n=1 Tax=Candidatus Marinarcus aquaticus TaxID=2044504 RepID=A0A4Q0XQX7_9BACT|nr:LUD domain-containing protein [Candidatus Marinarcus aquaticus]RXJ58018.1 hypothetical protein CRV04_05800 [Candidatus Marinarcus aquaticus]
MSRKSDILNAIKENNIIQEIPLPNIESFGITFDNKFQHYNEVIQSVGGKAIQATPESLDETIQSLYPEAKLIASNVKECTLGNVQANEKMTPHELKDLDLAVVKGEFAIAENGAVWIKNSDNRHRALYFIAQNIVIIVPKNEILNNMHEAYERIDFDNAGYGCFVSGPSKTADIEQSLVIGAHGPKSGYVIFI